MKEWRGDAHPKLNFLELGEIILNSKEGFPRGWCSLPMLITRGGTPGVRLNLPVNFRLTGAKQSRPVQKENRTHFNSTHFSPLPCSKQRLSFCKQTTLRKSKSNSTVWIQARPDYLESSPQFIHHHTWGQRESRRLKLVVFWLCRRAVTSSLKIYIACLFIP